jgi:hypothetical protein
MNIISTELIQARRYYGSHAIGWLALVNGQPHNHVAGRRAKRDCLAFIAKLEGAQP